MTTASFFMSALPASALLKVRRSGIDVSGSPVVVLDDAVGEPLRCCLRNARHGEKVMLFGYEPPLPGGRSPYREIGAIVTHLDECGGPDPQDLYPADWMGRAQVLRAYDARGWIHPATTTHDGTNPRSAIAAVLAQPGVVQVHSRNVSYGCFMFSCEAAQ